MIDLLKKFKGYATTLISLYINAGRPIPDVVGMLREEWAIASNIKDKTTRTHVQSALERIINQLKGVPKAPENGMAVFAGLHMRSPGTYDWVMYIVIPPRPITTFKYICDSHFHTEILEQMLQTGATYGIIVIERGNAVIALLKGNYWKIVRSVEFFVPGKHHAGGQSAVRFKRQIEHLAEVFYKKVAEEANAVFLSEPEFKGVIVSGPGPTKDEFVRGGYLDYRLRDKVIAVVDSCCADEYGVVETVRKAWKHIRDNEYARAKKLVDLIMYYAVKKPDHIVYGREDVERAIDSGLAQLVVVSDDVGVDEVARLMLKCEERRIALEVIPRNVEESKTLSSTFNGYVAILRTSSALLEKDLDMIEYD